jgi:hypothetical protein
VSDAVARHLLVWRMVKVNKFHPWDFTVDRYAAQAILDQVAMWNWIATHRKTTLAEVIIEMAKPRAIASAESRVPFS